MDKTGRLQTNVSCCSCLRKRKLRNLPRLTRAMEVNPGLNFVAFQNNKCVATHHIFCFKTNESSSSGPCFYYPLSSDNMDSLPVEVGSFTVFFVDDKLITESVLAYPANPSTCSQPFLSPDITHYLRFPSSLLTVLHC